MTGPIAPLSAFLDEGALRAALVEILTGDSPVKSKQSAASRLCAAAFKDARAAVRDQFEGARLGGLPAARSLSQLQDVIITLLFESITELDPRPAPTSSERIAICAVGGYGRRALAPGSDIDLLFLTPYKQTPWGEGIIENTLYALWDMKLKVGHASRSADDCLRLAKQDLTIRTSLLEARHICGDAALTAELRLRLRTELFASTGREFIEGKLKERSQRHKRAGASRYLLEPNIKESKGGLRDLQSLFWIAKYLHNAQDADDLVEKGVFTAAEAVKFRNARLFLWTVRFWLHYLNKRSNDQLTFHLQLEIAERMGYRDRPGERGVERFMKRYFSVAKEVGDLTRIMCAALEESQQVARRGPGLFNLRALFGFGDSPGEVVTLENGRLKITDPEAIAQDPAIILRLFRMVADNDAPAHPATLRQLRRCLRFITPELRADPKAQTLFLDTLCSRGDPESALRLMNETGVLGRFIPEFQRVVGMMQFNMYHHYTVDEHTLRALGELAALERGERADDLPVSTAILRQSVNRRALYTALLLHDIGKGLPEDHSIAGERIAWEVGPRLGLSESDVETVAWLVRHHLLMSDTAQKRDLSDAQTLRDFTNIVNSRERLKLLMLLTVCDIRAVGPGVWNGWKAQLLRELYQEAESALTAGFSGARESRRARAAAAADQLAAVVDWSDAPEFATFRDRHYDAYWLGLPTEIHADHAEMLRRAAPGSLALDITPDPDRAATRLYVAMEDHQGLFARMAGAVALAGASVVDAKSFTTSDGLALATFWLQDSAGGAYDDPSRIKRLKQTIANTLTGEILPREALNKRRQDRLTVKEAPFTVAPRVAFDNAASELYTMVEVEGRDRLGLLYDLARVFADANTKIFSAVIATYGEHAVDVFYIRDVFGHKLVHEGKIEQIKTALMAALAQQTAPT